MDNTQKEVLLKKLFFKSMHRGCKEMDIILENFATKYLSQLSIEELYNYQELLNIPDVDLYNIVIGNYNCENSNLAKVILKIKNTIYSSDKL